MLRQPRHVRVSYLREVVERGGGEALQQKWMLLQSDEVRRSYVVEVLEAGR
jgi:hypothetical protein